MASKCPSEVSKACFLIVLLFHLLQGLHGFTFSVDDIMAAASGVSRMEGYLGSTLGMHFFTNIFRAIRLVDMVAATLMLTMSRTKMCFVFITLYMLGYLGMMCMFQPFFDRFSSDSGLMRPQILLTPSHREYLSSVIHARSFIAMVGFVGIACTESSKSLTPRFKSTTTTVLFYVNVLFNAYIGFGMLLDNVEFAWSLYGVDQPFPTSWFTPLGYNAVIGLCTLYGFALLFVTVWIKFIKPTEYAFLLMATMRVLEMILVYSFSVGLRDYSPMLAKEVIAADAVRHKMIPGMALYFALLISNLVSISLVYMGEDEEDDDDDYKED